MFFALFQSPLPGEIEQRVAVDDLDRPIFIATVTDVPNGFRNVAVTRLTTGGILDTTFNPLSTTPGS